jgi:hypothetical protein
MMPMVAFIQQDADLAARTVQLAQYQPGMHDAAWHG